MYNELWNKLTWIKLKWWYKKGHIEKDFQKEITKYISYVFWVYFHIQDIGLGYRFLDLFFIDIQWRTFYIEFKKIQWDTFNVSQFEESQIILLRELDERNKYIARVFIYSMKRNEYKVLTFSEIRKNKNKQGWVKLWNDKKRED
jgi:hypothetical protein